MTISVLIINTIEDTISIINTNNDIVYTRTGWLINVETIATNNMDATIHIDVNKNQGNASCDTDTSPVDAIIIIYKS